MVNGGKAGGGCSCGFGYPLVKEIGSVKLMIPVHSRLIKELDGLKDSRDIYVPVLNAKY